MNVGLSSRITTCRSCGSAPLDLLLDLGSQPPANSLRRDLAEIVPSFPLEICRCASCATVQLTVTVDPAYLFQQYVWVTGTSQTAQDYSRLFCERLRGSAKSQSQLFVVEVASNDGTFLRRFRDAGDRVLGVDPARNIAATANAAGIATWAEFFGRSTGERIRREMGPADVAYARNVLPHVPDPLDILHGLAECLAEQGIAAVEFHQADAILDELHYDSIYHEHLFYHSLASMEFLLNRAGLHAFDLWESPISGGSLVAVCSKRQQPASPSLAARREAEQRRGTNTLPRWQEFARRSREHREQLRELVFDAVRRGERLIGYGASARSSTLLNFCGIDHRHLLAIADRNPLKHQLWTAGTHVRVLPPGEALALRPDAVLLLAWNFREEIVRDLRENGYRGKVIVPLPHAPIVIAI